MEAMKRKSEKEWVPAGLENPSPRSPGPWTVAERRRRRTETVARCHMRFLQDRYARCGGMEIQAPVLNITLTVVELSKLEIGFSQFICRMNLD
jgi:hypothetical protein